LNRIQLTVCGVVFAVCASWDVQAQSVGSAPDYQVSTGVSAALYQSVFSFEQSFAYETAFQSRLSGLWRWQIGARVGFNPSLPEGFFRVLSESGMRPAVPAWAVGFSAAPLRFAGPMGFASALEFGYGFGPLRQVC
jgi:hypothetical protein